MIDLPFNQPWLVYLANHRPELVTKLFQAITFMGGVEGYLIVIALIYSSVSKRLAVRASIIVLMSMVANHLLKTLIQNPRPFVEDGTYLDYWAVSSADAAELAAEFSTPSGHAMGAAAFYGFLFLRTKNPSARIALVLIPMLIGVSRPILGVHYVEDIALGWLLGGGIAVMMAPRIDALWDRWRAIHIGTRATSVAFFSVAVWLATLFLAGRPAAELPTEFVGVLGFLSGVSVAAPIEARHLNYEAHGASTFTKVIRFLLMLFVLIAVLVALEIPTLALGEPHGAMESAWRYLRYATVGAVGVLIVPWIFIRTRLAPGSTDAVGAMRAG